MTKGLLKSATLHLGILLIFMYGAEIFKKNKRFEIYEIPLDIVDVSEETINKLEKPNKKLKKYHLKRINTLVRQNPSQGLRTLNLLWKKKKKKKKY